MPINNGTKKARARYSAATSAMTVSMPTATVRREIRGACRATSAGAVTASAATSATIAVTAAPADLVIASIARPLQEKSIPPHDSVVDLHAVANPEIGNRVLRQCLIRPFVHADGQSVQIGSLRLLLSFVDLVSDIRAAGSANDRRSRVASSGPHLIAKDAADHGAGDGADAYAAAA